MASSRPRPPPPRSMPALSRWIDGVRPMTPFGDSDVDAFFDAGARARLVDTGAGIGFERESFGELIAFIAEIPW